MDMYQHAPLMGAAWYERIGSGIMDVARSGVGLFTKLRGDKVDRVVEGPAPMDPAALITYGTLGALALLLVMQKPSSRRR